MLLKDCPVGSTIILGGVPSNPTVALGWGDFLMGVQEDKHGVFIVDIHGKMHRPSDLGERYHFEIVHAAPEPIPAPEPRITFTVGGQEFYVGQRVWSLVEVANIAKGVELEVLGSNGNRLCVRVPRTSIVTHSTTWNISTTPPAPHEWKRGDWARHESGKECFVCAIVENQWADNRDSLTVLFSNQDIVTISASEFTFIKHIDLPE